ncbi:hypothetical protein ALC62_07830, partial [Cyphomyrmex costatus]
FMIDTGSDLNLIKRSLLKNEVAIDSRTVFELTGITKGRTRTVGVATLRISDDNVLFHVVSDEFPIGADAIIGTEFFRNHKVTIDYLRECLVTKGIAYYFQNDETVQVPARTRKQMYVHVADPEIQYGYILSLDAGPQVYLGNAVVSNRQGKAHLYIVNTDEDINILK